jgi:hypothetical protein
MAPKWVASSKAELLFVRGVKNRKEPKYIPYGGGPTKAILRAAWSTGRTGRFS